MAKINTKSLKKAITGKKSKLLKTLSLSQDSLLEKSETKPLMDIDEELQKIKDKLAGLQLQRTDLQRGVGDVSSNLTDLKGEYATRVSLSNSLSDITSCVSKTSLTSDDSSLSYFSDCYLLDDDESGTKLKCRTNIIKDSERPGSSSSTVSEDRIEASIEMLKDHEISYL